jgi:hypothetical protein
MQEISLSWAASLAGTAFLVSLMVKLTKGIIKIQGDIWVNVAAIIYAGTVTALAFIATGRTSLTDIYVLVFQAVMVAAIATYGYEFVSNLPKKG